MTSERFKLVVNVDIEFAKQAKFRILVKGHERRTPFNYFQNTDFKIVHKLFIWL